MKGCTNLMFLYENVKFNEAYLENMYRKSLSTGKCIAEMKLNNYQEDLINPSSTEDEKKKAKIYNFLADRFEDISSIKEYGESSKKDVFKSQNLIGWISLINKLKTHIKKQFILKNSILKFLVAMITSISMFIICYGTSSNIIFSISIGINAIANLVIIERLYKYVKEKNSLLNNKNKNLIDMKI
ncbi:hypothetical protein [uncultured Clostridium sp.]|uniref:hypothetical protein n=1 Tax=uncultured Clostridium sp. TaxID=59620 RepID=UPI0025897754|nr:hypothetical protein [uncultured Clostridium sp.]MDU1349352.1 hypothetical protein [Clostridium argentinense]